jgi:aromatic-L-amino-acid decarboxylase
MRALKLWAVLRAYGREGLQQRIRTCIDLAAQFEELVRADDRFEVVAPRPFSCVCFRVKGSDEENDALLERVNATGVCFLSHTALNGQRVMRFAVGNMRTTPADIELSWETIRAAL